MGIQCTPLTTQLHAVGVAKLRGEAYGIFGVDGSAAISNHPEVAILGVVRMIDKPWVVDCELAVRKVKELTPTFDHRACDGGTAAGFLRSVADAIENPASMLADT